MKGIVRRLISVIAALALVVSIVGLGFFACLMPITTHGLSTVFADDVASPFDRTQLVQVADATRDYAFGNHDVEQLYATIASVDREYQEGVQKSGGKVPSSFPNLSALGSNPNEVEYRSAFFHASDVYCYTEAEIIHLDDCYAVYCAALPIIIGALVIAIGCLIAVGVLGKKNHLGGVLMAGGLGTLALFILLALWALFDFSGFFTSFHKLFFANNSWTFPADSLLICALPLNFWIGMGGVWLLTALICAALCYGIGSRLRGRKHKLFRKHRSKA